MTPQLEYVTPVSRENATALFIDNQTNLMLAVRSIDSGLLARNTEGLANIAKMFGLPVALTTTGGGATGPAGPLLPAITECFPEAEAIDRTLHINAMAEESFAAAVRSTGRRKILMSGIATDYCLLYPTQTLVREGFHVLIVVDASGSFSQQTETAALNRLQQMGATLTTVQSLLGELLSSLSEEDPSAASAMQAKLAPWFTAYTGAPALMIATRVSQ